jgi:hypothetical protein
MRDGSGTTTLDRMTSDSRPSGRPRRVRAAAALLAGAALAALPATAAADSIVFVEGGNVFSARPDGGGKVQLTDGGNWHSPTQADDGTIAAVQGTGPIVVMARDGRPLRTITTQPAPSGDGGTFAPRPVQLSFSPDGSKIAYAYVAGSCPVASSCGTIQRSTFYTRADVTEATAVSVWGNQFSVSNPEWVTNERTLVFGGYGSQVSIDDLGPGDYSQRPWITPDADMGDGEVSRDGRRLATTFFYGKETVLALFAVNGDVRTETPPPPPSVACEVSPADERFGDPSWSPDGSGLAYESSRGVETLRFTAFGPEVCETTGPSVVLSAGGSEPDWGPADPPAARWTPPPVDRGGPGGGERPGGGRTPGGGRGGSAKATVKLAASPAVTVAALRRGLALKVRVSTAGRVTATFALRRRTAAFGSATARRAGVVTVKLRRLPAGAARRLRGRRLTLTLRHGTARATATFKVR